MTWFLLTVKGDGFMRRILVRGRSGAEVERVVQRYRLDCDDERISWEPLDGVPVGGAIELHENGRLEALL